MNIEEFRDYCLSLNGVTESFPFDEVTLVFKVGDKMFALCDIDHFDFVNLKCDPARALELRAEFQAVKPGWHMSKTHWNSVYVNQDVKDDFLKELIDHSYGLIVASLPKSKRESL